MGTALTQVVWPLKLVQDTYLTQARGVQEVFLKMDGSKLMRLLTGGEGGRGNENHSRWKPSSLIKEQDTNKTLETTVSLVTCSMSCFLHSSHDCQGLGFLAFSVAGIL